ncbi:MAG TPA: hypothetical protein PK513_03945 [Alphaproteobacteria bacterium]|nr:hypothetical protein [Alphaproteobacteria bacterium]USO05698.1 MAG: hypothetical protein H6859_00380 [Rhodospirillales bacterium]HOO81635.1 hypothetical protein [Alphaproteobacteria bacterium]
MLVNTGNMFAYGRRERDPILSIGNLYHYSDPALSKKVFHSENYLEEIHPIKGTYILEQPAPESAMHFNPAFFNGLGGYGFEDVARWMMYDADPTPFQVERTIGMVIDMPGPFENNQIFGFSKFNAFNTHWRLSTSGASGGRITYGRAEDHPDGEFPSLVTGALGASYIIIIRQVSLTQHEFYINSPDNPVILNPNDGYWTFDRIRLMLGRIGGTRSETGVRIGPIFDAFCLISPGHLRKIMEFWSARTGIPLT